MEERDVAIVQQGAVEKYPGNKTRYITDNGKQFTSREFRRFIAYHGLTHVRISPGYPQSNGKLERFHLSIKGEALDRKALVSVEQAKDIIKGGNCKTLCFAILGTGFRVQGSGQF
jgi:transposase InsO family protein